MTVLASVVVSSSSELSPTKCPYSKVKTDTSSRNLHDALLCPDAFKVQPLPVVAVLVVVITKEVREPLDIEYGQTEERRQRESGKGEQFKNLPRCQSDLLGTCPFRPNALRSRETVLFGFFGGRRRRALPVKEKVSNGGC